MKRSKKGPKPVHKNKFQPKKILPLIQTNNSNKSTNLKSQNDSKMKPDLKRPNKKKLNNNLTRVYILGSGVAFFIYIHFIFSSNFKFFDFPIPSIFQETPIAAFLDYYWGFSQNTMKRFFHLFSFAMSFYYLLYSMRCDPELSFAYCLIIILDPYFSGHFLSSNFLFFSLVLSIFSFKLVFYSLTSFKKIDNKYRLMMALVCLLNGINLSIRFESISLSLVQIISTFMRAFKKKKVNKELLLAPIIMIIAESLVFILLCFLFGFPQKVHLHFESIENFMDELKLYFFNKTFFVLAFFSVLLYFVANFKISHKIFLFSILISSFLAILIPIQTNDYSIQIRLLYMQFMLFTCFGTVICRPLYFAVSGTFLGCFIFASWVLRYKLKSTQCL
ncbi:hypothetical protein M9Y10_013165 [Tritrichomonas musculus]|uniref:Uncharacterized protein n=1 Tax=Tritrichomonas musculus TaxID=1915356 RepID=A0ABR2I8T1_9EUKA